MRVAKVLIYDEHDYALILFRSNTHPLYPLEADLPGGAIEKGETYAEGLAREIIEEIGVTVDASALTMVAPRSGPILAASRLFEVHLDYRPDVTLSFEHNGFEWVAKTELVGRLVTKDSYMKLVKRHLNGIV